MRLRPTAVLLLLLGFGPGLAHGLALGDIELKSGLNEPLLAEIAVLSAAPDELTNLSARIAPRETFARYGLDRPDFLSGLVFTVERSGGQDVLRVVSRQAIPEPFVTFLVEAQWRRGRLLREYTVLLDPPVFMPIPEDATPAPAPIAAPRGVRSQTSPTTGTVVRSEPRPAPRSAPRRFSTTAPAYGSDYGPIQRNETLWRIAEGLRTDRSITMNQMMVAIYQANQGAFLGNINLMKEGSVLRIPERAEIAAFSQQQAFSMAVAHNDAWRAGRPSQVARVSSAQPAASTSRPEPSRLKLVEPDISVSGADETSGAGDAGASAARESLARNQADIARLSGENQQLRADLDEIRRLISLKDAELAQLQERLAAGPAVAPATTTVPATTAGMPATSTESPTTVGADTAVTSPDTAPPTSSTSTPVGAGEPAVAVTTDAATTADSTDTTQPDTTASQRPVATTSLPEEPGFFSKLIDAAKGLLGSVWLWIALGLAVLAAFALVALRGRREPGSDTLEALAREDESGKTAAVPKLEAADVAVDQEVEFFDDSGTFKPVDFAAAKAVDSSETSEYPFEDTIGAGGELNLDQSDPLAEADFHMAYGLYDQAADLVKKAVAREPGRLDLRMKLLEIFFVWGNQDEFRSTAQDMRDNLSAEVEGEWDKIVIMGKQICPEDELFAGSGGMSSGADIDLEFDAGDSAAQSVDFETFEAGDAKGVDLDFGGAFADAESPAEPASDESQPAESASAGPSQPAEQLQFDDDVDGLDFDLGLDFTESVEEPGPQPVAQDDIKDQIRARLNSTESEETAEMDLSDLGVDLDLGGGDESDGLDSVFTDAGEQSDNDVTGQMPAPTAEMAAAHGLDLDIGGAFGDLDSGDEDETARDLAALEESMAKTGPHAPVSPDEDTGHFSAEIETLHGDALDVDISAFTDSDQTRLIEGADEPTGAHNEEAFSVSVFGADEDADNTKMIGPDDRPSEAAADDDDFSSAVFGGSEDETALIDVSDGLETDVFGIDNTGAQNLDLDIGDSLDNGGGEDRTTVKVATADLALPEGDDELGEVGTKLDLARAYMDMGDPEGARGILEEVLSEGNETQQADAKELLENLS